MRPNDMPRPFAPEHSEGAAMADTLAQRARELVANKLRITRHFQAADEIEAGKYPTPEIASSVYFEVIIDLVAALRQAQQPGAQAVAWRYRFNKAVEWLYSSKEIRPSPRDGLEAEPLYTAPPPLPEGVSEEAIERVAALLYTEATDEPWLVAGVAHTGPDRDYYRALARRVLAAKGGIVKA